MSAYNYFTHTSNDELSRQLMNTKTRELSYSLIDMTTHYWIYV